MLFSQYFYYRSKAKPEHAVAPRRASQLRRHASEHEHYRQLSAAAANVAAAAAIAASEEDFPPQRVRSWRSVDDAEMTKSEAAEAEDEVDEAALIALADSFHSDSGRKHVSWSQERPVTGSGGSQLGRGGSRSRTRQGPALTMSPIATRHATLHSPDQEHLFVDPEVSGDRGRPLQRQVIESPIDALGLDIESQEAIHIRPRERKESRASRKSAALVFLGVWALFGIGSVTKARMARREVGGFVMEHDSSLSVSIPSTGSFLDDPGRISFLLFGEEPSTERILGRLSAWMCTTLYLTSRLPQIWKNVCS